MRIRKALWNNDAEPVIVIMVILLVLGTINVFSSSFVMAATENDNPYLFLQKHLVMLVIGTAAFIACRKIHYTRWRTLMPWLLFGTLLCLVLVLFIGTSVNGAKRWLFIGQPAELAKLMALILTAAYIDSRARRNQPVSFLNRQFLFVAAMAGLTEVEPDMGTACIIAGVPVLMYFVAGVKKGERRFLGVAAVVLATAMVIWQPYRLDRIKILFDPWADAQGVGYQVVQSLSTIGSGGLWGMGLGAGVSKYDYLPEAHTDFAFAIFCQEHGYILALMVFLLYAFLTLFCARIANIARDAFGQVLAVGIMILIVGQAIVNLMMVGGIFPVVGVPLPFISYGGSSLVVSMAAMGMLANIADHGEHRKRDIPQAPASEESGRPKLHLVKGQSESPHEI